MYVKRGGEVYKSDKLFICIILFPTLVLSSSSSTGQAFTLSQPDLKDLAPREIDNYLYKK